MESPGCKGWALCFVLVLSRSVKELPRDIRLAEHDPLVVGIETDADRDAVHVREVRRFLEESRIPDDVSRVKYSEGERLT